MVEPSKKKQAWAIFDRLVADAVDTDDYAAGPWEADQYTPDFGMLERLLGVPLYLNASSQSGVPALALDVWVAYELRRAGFSADAVWPRAEHPRVMPGPIANLIPQSYMKVRPQLIKQLTRVNPLPGVVATSANILGKNYVKQVDVVMSAWDTGPELLLSTKRMDSSFGKNAANRIEESYGDAKNLRARHPLATLGFLYGLRSTILQSEPEKAKWLIDLLQKLGREDDAYDAVCLLMLFYKGDAPRDSDGGYADDDDAAVAGVSSDVDISEETAADSEPDTEGDVQPSEIDRALAQLPVVRVLHDTIPPELQASRFLQVMVEHVLNATPVNMHKRARILRGWVAADT